MKYHGNKIRLDEQTNAADGQPENNAFADTVVSRRHKSKIIIITKRQTRSRTTEKSLFTQRLRVRFFVDLRSDENGPRLLSVALSLFCTDFYGVTDTLPPASATARCPTAPTSLYHHDAVTAVLLSSRGALHTDTCMS